MTTKPIKDGRPACNVITLPDPDNMPPTHNAEQGGTIEWRTETHLYPNFEIRFKGANPFTHEQDLVVAGSDLKPVVMRLKHLGKYEYTTRFFKPDGSFKDLGISAIHIRVCNGCPDPDPGPNGNQ